MIMEDKDAVIHMTLKKRSPQLRRVARTHRVNLDALWERVMIDPGINIKYMNTKLQLADLLTKGSFTVSEFEQMCSLQPLRP